MVQQRVLSLVIVAVAIGCVHVSHIENQRLRRYEAGAGYGSKLAPDPFDGELRVVLAFSGGGTRAAALAYGVLEEMRATEVVIGGQKRPLLEAVTTISSVSGGSFTAAYYGLYGDRIFQDFEERFLRQNIEGRLIGNLLRPLEFLRLQFTPYTRSDLAADIYDEKVFDGATFADLAQAGGPVLNINATDLDVGTVFTFVQPEFNLICSDLSKMRVSHAVTASSAVPGAFAPLRLKNFAGTCELPEPEWIEEALANPRASRRRHHEAVYASSYLDAKKRPNLFLVDGGVADNIGAHRIIADVVETGGYWQLAKENKLTVPSTVLYIVVNAQPGKRHTWVEKGPSLTDVLGALTSVGMHRYNFETIELLRYGAAQWSKEASQRGHRVNTYVSEVAFSSLSDPAERRFFDGVATSFDLDDETIDRLIEVGGRLLRESPDFQEFMAGRK